MKGGKRKLFVSIGISLIILLVASVFITAADIKGISPALSSAVDKVASSPELASEVYRYIADFVEKRGVAAETINNITKVDFNSLPKEVNIENVNDANLAIYQIDYNNPYNPEKDKLFVVTYSVEKLKSQGDIIISQDKREFLNFGFGGEMSSSGFLNTAIGVEGSFETGYVMMRYGSITGLSTSLNTLKGKGEIAIVIYKNGQLVEFGNTFVVDSVGAKTDYDVQSKDIVTFEPGDIISIYVDAKGSVSWKDVVTLLEITTES